ncbi:MAG: hypothetical protein JWN41_1165, partial [Thermoleophilia bacterium]|nr:hypothetical protein [Thermoleophilia bacterium]
MPERTATQRHWPFVFAIALLAMANSLVWSLQLPADGSAPDEPAHEAVAQYFARHAEMPRLGERGFGIRLVPVRAHARDFPKFPYQPYATHPPGAYALAAVWMAGHSPQPEGTAEFRWSRTSQLLLVGAFVALTFAAARLMFPRRREIWVVSTCLIALWPEVTFLFAYLNPDALAAVAGVGIVAAWFRGARRGWRVRDALLVGVALAIALVAKPTAWPLIAFTLPLAAISWRSGPLRTTVARVAACGAALVVLAGPWAVQQMSRYGGDLTGVFVQREAVRAAGATAIDGPTNGVSYLQLLTDYDWLATTTRTFVLGIPSHQASLAQLGVFAALLAGGLAGWLRSAWELRSMRRPHRRDVAWVHVTTALSIPALAIIASLNAWRGDIVFQGQGRYLFPVLVPFVVYALTGSLQLLARRGRVMQNATLTALLVAACAIEVSAERALSRAFAGGEQFAAALGICIPLVIVATAAGWLWS